MINRSSLFKKFSSTILFIVLIGLTACSTNQATGRNQLLAMSGDQEKKIGAENHPKILDAFGGAYEDDELAFYVTNLVARLAAQSELAGDELRVTVLNSPVVNAMALPGGYVYVTRGLLALAPDEAALASVMAHELGHVTARHSAERQTQSIGASIATLGVAILTGSRQAAQLAQQGGQLYLLSYSRDQEREADALGSRYMKAAGYDLYAQADMFESMGALEKYETEKSGGNAAPQILRSHPLSAERSETARKKAEIAGTGGTTRNKAAYMSAINGMIYGDGPEEGFVKGRRFEHPGLRIAFEVPEGFTLQNTSKAVVAKQKDGTAIVFDSVKSHASPRDHIRYDWAKGRNPIDETVPQDSPLSWASALYHINGKGVQLSAIKTSRDKIYRFAVIGEKNKVRENRGDYFRMVRGFEEVSVEQASRMKPLRIITRQAEVGDTIASLAALGPFPDDRETRFRLINGLSLTEKITPGQWIKIISE